MSQQPEKSVAQVLRDAADLLMRTGWTRFSYRTQDCAGHERFCVLGAISRVTNSFNGDVNANLAARSALVAVLGGYSVVRFNDEIANRRSEVVAKLRQAADLAEGNATHV